MPLNPGRQATVVATLKLAGSPVAIPLAAAVTAQLFAADGTTALGLAKPLQASTSGANWPQGVVVAEFSAVETTGITGSSVVVVFAVLGSGLNRTWSVRVEVEDDAFVKSALFPDRTLALSKLRRSIQFGPGASLGLDVGLLSDDMLWDKLLAAEAHVAHELRVPLQPTHFFPRDPSSEQIAALPVGMPWAVDPAYDYDAENFYGDKWGMITTRQKPIQRIVGMRFVYPTPQQTILDVPFDWIRADKKFGQVQLVPTGTSYQTLLGGLFMSHISGGRSLPFTIDLEYVAGLANVQRDFPDLLDAVGKLAMAKIVEDAFLPTSGSISADGLSQSTSVDTSKYHDAVDRILNGANGNGGLMARIHGIRTMVL